MRCLLSTSTYEACGAIMLGNDTTQSLAWSEGLRACDTVAQHSDSVVGCAHGKRARRRVAGHTSYQRLNPAHEHGGSEIAQQLPSRGRQGILFVSQRLGADQN
jgi:hypothetical protein